MGVEGICAGLGNGLVRAENEMQGAVEYECILLDHVRESGIRREPERGVRTNVADVVAAVRRTAGTCAIVTRRAKSNANSRCTGFRPDAPKQHHRREHATDVFVTRCDVGDPYGTAIRVVQHRIEDGGICLISLFAVRKIYEFDFEETRQVRFAIVSKQPAKDRVRIELRHACPYHRGPFVDERCYLAVADQTDV